MLGLLSLTLTGEVENGFLLLSWTCWAASFALDRFPHQEQRLRRLETAAVIGLVVLFLVDFFLQRHTVFLSITHLLLMFQNFKWLGEKKRKDILQILFFSFFQILAACTLSLAIWHALILLVMIPSATAALFWHQVVFHEEESGRALPAGARNPYRALLTLICAVVLPMNILLTAGVFVLFPRLNWNLPLSRFASGRIGYTDQVNLSHQGTLHPDNSVVMWLDIPDRAERNGWTGYLRGTTLDFFDGKQWSSRVSGGRIVAPGLGGLFTFRPLVAQSATWRASVMLLNPSAATLFHTGRVLHVAAPLSALQEDSAGCLHWMGGWNRPLRYALTCETGSILGARETVHTPAYLQLPALSWQRTAALGQQIGGSGSTYNEALAIQQFLQGHYRYTLDLGSDITPNPVDDFLFVRKAGPCGYYASAMAVLLRLRGIPCRIVAGYLRGEWNEEAQEFVVREKDAHAWVEVYLKGIGWATFDPSPRQPTVTLGRSRRWLYKLEQYWDFCNLEWARLVIQYDLYSQLRALEHLRHSSEKLNDWVSKRWPDSAQRPGLRVNPEISSSPLSWKQIRAVLMGLAISAAGLWVFMGRRLRIHDPSPEVRAYRRWLQRMERAGLAKGRGETGQEFARRLSAARPAARAQAALIIDAYYEARFALKH